MRFVISGGAPLDPKIQKGFIDLGIDMVQGYGLTETSPVIAAENMYKSRTGSIGIPMENVTIEIVNKDDNGIGELRAKGPNVMLGYYENEEATNESFIDGYFKTPTWRITSASSADCSAVALTSGKRTPPTGNPSRFKASFTMMGLEVMKSSFMSGRRASLAFAAASKSPAAQRSTISFMRSGATFPMVEMTPAPPSFMMS